MPQFKNFSSRLIPLLIDNIDTDQIIPARFLKVTDTRGLGDNLFADWRYDDAGVARPEFPLNRPEYHGASILLAGDNFGCGSSREHAPWALAGYGIRAIISTSFADIFSNNALKNGLLPIKVDRGTHQALARDADAIPGAELTVDLVDQTLSLPGGRRVSFPIDSFAKTCLVEGVDEMGYLMRFGQEITDFEARAML